LIAPPMPQERFLGLLRQRLNKPTATAAPPAETTAAVGGGNGHIPVAANSRA
jgi:hypothetical protein